MTKKGALLATLFLLLPLSALLAAYRGQSSGLGQTGVDLVPASAKELRSLNGKLKVEIMRTNPDSLGNARLTARIENSSGRSIALAKLAIDRGADSTVGKTIGEAEVRDLAIGQPVTVSVPTAADPDDLAAADLKLRVTKAWFER